MNLIINADIQDDYYGRYERNPLSGEQEFVPKGKAVYLSDIIQNIDDDTIMLELCFEYQGSKKYVTVDRKDLINKSAINSLANNGADVTSKTADVFVDSIRVQENAYYSKGKQVTKVYKGLGWIKIPKIDDGKIVGYTEEYRSYVLIPSGSAKYIGDYDIKPEGSYLLWKDRIIKDVIGHIPLEIVLLTSLSAPVNGLISPYTTNENSIVHLNFPSSRGKTAALQTAISTASAVYEGTRPFYENNGQVVQKRSALHSWMATGNAIISTHLLNEGFPAAMNESGKCLEKDLTPLIFALSEGSDKMRSNPKQETRVSRSYHTTFLSCGEETLQTRCRTKFEGIDVRVLTIESELTKDAQHAERLKRTCFKNYGHANPILVDHIIKKGGRKYVQSIYDEWLEEFRGLNLTAPNADRFSEKFAVLFLTTATIATEALKIPFSIEKIKEFFIQYDKERAINDDIGLSSYKTIIEDVEINKGNYVKKDTSLKKYIAPFNRVYGRIKDCNYTDSTGKTVIKEYEVKPSIVKGILKRNHYTNLRTCIEKWQNNNLISCDADRPTRSRKIEPNSKKCTDVYVFKVFEDDVAEEDSDEQ